MPEKIGDNLVKIGAMTQEQVDDILRRQKDGDSRLFGERCHVFPDLLHIYHYFVEDNELMFFRTAGAKEPLTRVRRRKAPGPLTCG